MFSSLFSLKRELWLVIWENKTYFPFLIIYYTLNLLHVSLSYYTLKLTTHILECTDIIHTYLKVLYLLPLLYFSKSPFPGNNYL